MSATRDRNAEDMIASLMQEMGQQQGYQPKHEDIKADDTRDPKSKTHISNKYPNSTYERLLPELPNYPDNHFKAGSESIWNPIVSGECGSNLMTSSENRASRILAPTIPQIEVIRRRVFEKLRQQIQTLLQEFQTKHISTLVGKTATSGSFSKNKNKLPIPSMIDKWHMDSKIAERNGLLKQLNEFHDVNWNLSRDLSISMFLREITRRKQRDIPIFDPVLLSRESPELFVESVLKPEVQKLFKTKTDKRNDNSPFTPRFNKKMQQLKRALYRLICEAFDSFDTQLLHEARRESNRSITTLDRKRPKISRATSDNGSPSLVRVTFSGVTFKIHPAYLEKLQRLYDRTKYRLCACGHNEETFDSYHQLSFEEALFCLLCRYDMIQGAGLQAGVPGSIMDVLLERFNCRMESFASPLNCRYDKFASAFVDVDAPFGSQGSFFELPLFSVRQGELSRKAAKDSSENSGICFEANPPFCEGIILEMSDRISDILGPRQNDRPIMFVVFVPAWRNSECYKALLENERLTQHLLLKQGEHWYAEGTQHRRKDSFRVASFDTSIFFYQNEAARQLWNVQSDNEDGTENTILQELRTAFGKDPGKMEKDCEKITTMKVLSVKKESSDDWAVSASTPTPTSCSTQAAGAKKRSKASLAEKKSNKKKAKKDKRNWNQADEGKAQLDLLASLGLSPSMEKDPTVKASIPMANRKEPAQKKKKKRKQR